MPSELVSYFKFDYPGEETFFRIKIWKVDPHVKGSCHNYKYGCVKYSCVYVVNGICVLH